MDEGIILAAGLGTRLQPITNHIAKAAVPVINIPLIIYQIYNFQKNGIKLNARLFALSELIQWVWRSQIRDGKPIKLYLPSKRMRQLFQSWMRGEHIEG